MFHSYDQRPQKEDIKGTFKQYQGNDTPFLEIDPCKEVTFVRLGPQTPLTTIEWDEILDTTLTRLKHHSEPAYSLIHPEGKSILRRHIGSNHGIWQWSETIWVAGIWEDEQASSDEAKSDSKSVKPDRKK